MIKVFFKTFGCSTNLSETEVMKGLLNEAKFEIVNHYIDADVIIINMCSVKTPAYIKAVRAISAAKRLKNKRLIIAGCIPKHAVKEFKILAPNASLISTNNLTEIVSVVEETINNNPIELTSGNTLPKINLPRIRNNNIISIIPISNSCIDNCTYCSVRSIKGSFRSYPVQNILRELKNSVVSGCKEVWLTSQDNGCYGTDINTNLVELLNKVIHATGKFKVRLGMMNPTHIKPFLNELIEVYQDDKMFKFIHLPVQSGNDEVLKKMGRRYSVEEFRNIVSAFRQSIPQITLSTDIICGFPGETEEQFNDSIRLIKEIRPDVLNISRYWARPGTAASRMKEQVHGNMNKERSRRLHSIFEFISYENNRRWRGWEGDVIIDENGKENTLVGRNFAYKPVIIEGNYQLGEIVNVRVNKFTIYDLRAEVI